MSDDEGDPFEELEEDVEDREGDPFETLTADSDEDDQETTDTDPLADAEAGSGDDTEETTHHDSPAEETTPSNQGPAGSLGGQPGASDAEIAGGGGPASGQQADEGDEQVAEEMGAGEMSGMDFGTGRDAEGSPDVATDAFEDVGQREGDPFEGANSAFEERDVQSIDPDQVWEGLESAEARGSVGEASKRTYAEVSKHSFCEQCEHFSEPPNISCAHEGTEIVEFLDMETVRVVDCPIVSERRELEQEE